jgi:hypothetical protein
MPSVPVSPLDFVESLPWLGSELGDDEQPACGAAKPMAKEAPAAHPKYPQTVLPIAVRMF